MVFASQTRSGKRPRRSWPPSERTDRAAGEALTGANRDPWDRLRRRTCARAIQSGRPGQTRNLNKERANLTGTVKAVLGRNGAFAQWQKIPLLTLGQ